MMKLLFRSTFPPRLAPAQRFDSTGTWRMNSDGAAVRVMELIVARVLSAFSRSRWFRCLLERDWRRV